MKLVGRKLRGAEAVQTILVAVVLAAMSGIIGGEIFQSLLPFIAIQMVAVALLIAFPVIAVR